MRTLFAMPSSVQGDLRRSVKMVMGNKEFIDVSQAGWCSKTFCIQQLYFSADSRLNVSADLHVQDRIMNCDDVDDCLATEMRLVSFTTIITLILLFVLLFITRLWEEDNFNMSLLICGYKAHRHKYKYNSVSPINPTVWFLDCGRKPHTETGRTIKNGPDWLLNLGPFYVTVPFTTIVLIIVCVCVSVCRLLQGTDTNIHKTISVSSLNLTAYLRTVGGNPEVPGRNPLERGMQTPHRKKWTLFSMTSDCANMTITPLSAATCWSQFKSLTYLTFR